MIQGAEGKSFDVYHYQTLDDAEQRITKYFDAFCEWRKQIILHCVCSAFLIEQFFVQKGMFLNI